MTLILVGAKKAVLPDPLSKPQKMACGYHYSQPHGSATPLSFIKMGIKKAHRWAVNN